MAAPGTPAPDLEKIHDLLNGEPPKQDPHHSNSRALPMKVLCLGLGRTALAAALTHLGYKPYDFIDRFYRQHLHLWDDAVRAKFLGQGALWGKDQFDSVTGDFDSLLDIPCCLFADDLVAAYPDAKVILNVRDDPDKWLRSMQNTLFAVFAWPSWKILQYTEPTLCGRWFSHVNLIMKVFCDGDQGQLCKERYLLHNENVRKIVPAGRLLEYKVSEGWEPLCRFLEQPLPEEEFPKGNDPAEFVSTHKKLRRMAVYISGRRIARYTIPLALVMIGRWAYMKWA